MLSRADRRNVRILIRNDVTPNSGWRQPPGNVLRFTLGIFRPGSAGTRPVVPPPSLIPPITRTSHRKGELFSVRLSEYQRIQTVCCWNNPAKTLYFFQPSAEKSSCNVRDRRPLQGGIEMPGSSGISQPTVVYRRHPLTGHCQVQMEYLSWPLSTQEVA